MNKPHQEVGDELLCYKGHLFGTYKKQAFKGDILNTTFFDFNPEQNVRTEGTKVLWMCNIDNCTEMLDTR